MKLRTDLTLTRSTLLLNVAVARVRGELALLLDRYVPRYFSNHTFSMFVCINTQYVVFSVDYIEK